MLQFLPEQEKNDALAEGKERKGKKQLNTVLHEQECTQPMQLLCIYGWAVLSPEQVLK